MQLLYLRRILANSNIVIRVLISLKIIRFESLLFFWLYIAYA